MKRLEWIKHEAFKVLDEGWGRNELQREFDLTEPEAEYLCNMYAQTLYTGE
jgi:hypothetical protein